MSDSATPVISAKMAADLRKRAGRFRILVIGQANAGKTTILQKVCNTTDQPEIFDGRGRKLDPAVVNPTGGRGIHDINNELVFQSSPGFVFHDSRGFEAGAVDELDLVKGFIESRLKRKRLDQQLHAIWYCLPMDSSRPISRAEELFFSECGTGKVPVILIFTKFDGYIKLCFSNLLNQGTDRTQAKAKAASIAEDGLVILQKSLLKYKYPPKRSLHLRDMHKPQATCDALIEQTSAALDNEVLTQIFVSTQQVTARVSTKYALDCLLDKLDMHNNKLLSQMSIYYFHSQEREEHWREWREWQWWETRTEHAANFSYTKFSSLVLEHLSDKVPSSLHDKKQKIFLGLSLAIVAEHSFPSFGFQGSFQESLALYISSNAYKNVLEVVSHLPHETILLVMEAVSSSQDKIKDVSHLSDQIEDMSHSPLKKTSLFKKLISIFRKKKLQDIASEKPINIEEVVNVEEVVDAEEAVDAKEVVEENFDLEKLIDIVEKHNLVKYEEAIKN